MSTLQSCYELDFSKIDFLERKKRITHPKTILKGPSKSGKSYLIFDYLSNFESQEYLYIDFNDLKNNVDFSNDELKEFIQSKKIKVLVLENFSYEFDLPYCDSIIISSSIKKEIKGFKLLKLMPLDFEEFLLHDHKHQNITNAFNSYFKYGNLPEILHIDEIKKIKRLQEILHLCTLEETKLEIFKQYIMSMDEKKSILQLYTSLKKTHKISKDKFYEYSKYLEENNQIFFLEKFEQKKAIKKIYTYNPSLFSAMSHSKKFKNEFSNYIFLELFNKYKNFYYLDYVDFYIPHKKMAIIAHPFFNKLLANSLKKKTFNLLNEYGVKKLFIVSIGNSDQFVQENIEIQVIPFYEWAVLN